MDDSCQAVLVAGCFPQRYRGDIRTRLPEVDAFIGLDDLDRVADTVQRLARGEQGIVEVSEKTTRLFEPALPGVVFSTGPYAYLKVAEGCNHRCTFCAIPGIRGAYRSRPIDAIAREAENLLARGFRELDLISQDITSYGRDRQDAADLPALLRALGRLGGHFWIRLLYGYPAAVTDSLLAAMAEVPAVCHYLDLPIQHSHPDVLRAMGRNETVASIREMAARIRRVLPDAVLRTTCLVGFPGETDEHFDHLLAFMKETAFDHLGAFVFSPEQGTPAFRLPNRPSRETAEARRDQLMLAQQEIVHRRSAALVGTKGKVLLERPHPQHRSVWVGRSYRQAPEVGGEVWGKGAPGAAPLTQTSPSTSGACR